MLMTVLVMVTGFMLLVGGCGECEEEKEDEEMRFVEEILRHF